MATYRWIGGAGSFDAASSWQVVQNGVYVGATIAPSTGDLAEIETPATIFGPGTAQQLVFDALTTISGTDQVGNLSIISYASAADVVVASQWYDSSSLIVGENAAGTLSIAAGATAEIGGQLMVGINTGSAGTLTIGAGGTLQVDGDSNFLGGNAGATGEVFISGTGALLSLAGQLEVGAHGTGEIGITDGGSLASGDEYDAIGVLGGSGTVVVDGAGSQWSGDTIGVGCTGDGTLIISDDGAVSSEDITGVGLTGGGAGTLFIESGGVLTSAGTTAAVIGDAVGGSGSVAISGAGSAWRMSSNLAIGAVAPGQVFIGTGATLQSGGTSDALGSQAGGTGQVSISGAGALWITGGQLTVGSSGTGAIAVTDGGSLASSGEYDGIGVFAGSSGTVVVDGPGSRWTSGDQIAVGCTGDGTLIISNDGYVSSEDITGVSQTGGGAGGGTGTVLIESGGVFSSGGSVTTVGDATGGSGSVTITGPESTWRMTSNFGVGVSEAGAVNVLAGATLSTGGSAAALGVFSGGSGTVVVDGSGSNWQSNGQIVVGEVGSGAIEIGTGALVSAGTLGITTTGSVGMSGGTLDVASVTSLSSGAFLVGAGTVASSVFNSGTIVATGALDFLGQFSGGGLFDIGPSGDAIFDSTVLTGTTLDFSGGAGRVDLTSPASFGGVLAGFAGGETIFAAGAPSLSFGGGSVITLLDGSGDGVGTIALAGSYAAGSFFDNDGTITDGPGQIACFVAGTRIATPDGEVAVECLARGDLVMTDSGVARPVKWIGRRSYEGRFIAGRRDVLPIVISAGAIADGVPARDLAVSPRHALFLDGMLVPAERLVNGRSIVQQTGVAAVAYHHVELDSHDILLAEGVATESFIDLDSRMMFQNATEFLSLYPGAAPAHIECAPRIEAGEALLAIRRRLAARAGLANCHEADADRPGRLDGRVDEADQGGITGWAFDAARPHSPVRLDIFDGATRLGTVLADAHRSDLAAAGKGAGRCGFALRFDPPLDPAAAHFLRVRRSEDGAALGPPLALAAQPTEPGALDGRIDRLDANVVEGWARDTAWPDHPVLLEVIAAGRVVGRVLANRSRPDLAEAGLGACAFIFRLPAARGAVQLRRVSDGARLADGRRRRVG